MLNSMCYDDPANSKTGLNAGIPEAENVIKAKDIAEKEGTMKTEEIAKKEEMDQAPGGNFSEILRQYRKKARLSQQELALGMNVTRNTIINWESGRNKPDYSCIPALCSLLDIPVHKLFDMPSDVGLSLQEEQVLANFRLLSPLGRNLVDKVLGIMVDEELSARQSALRENTVFVEIRPAAVAAGAGVEVADAVPSYTFLRRNSINARADGIVRVSGDSMEPVYHDGDYVYYAATEEARPGTDIIVDTDDGAVIKRVAEDRSLCSLNADRPYPVKSEDNRLVVRGRVLGVVAESDYLSPKDRSLAEEIFEDRVREFRQAHHLDSWE